MYKLKGFMTPQLEELFKVMIHSEKEIHKDDIINIKFTGFKESEGLEEDSTIIIANFRLKTNKTQMLIGINRLFLYESHENVEHNHYWLPTEECLYCGLDRCGERDSLGLQCAKEQYHSIYTEPSFHASECMNIGDEMGNSEPLEFEVWNDENEVWHLRFTNPHGDCHCPRKVHQ